MTSIETNSKKIVLCAFTEQSLSIKLLTAYLRSCGFDVELIFLINNDDIHNYIGKFTEAHIVGVSLVTNDFPKAISLSNTIRERGGSRVPLIIFGGVHPTIRPEECLRHCDYVVRGEGEEALLDICTDASRIKSYENISYSENGKPIHNELRKLECNLDKYPFYKSKEEDSRERYMIMTSRGCPFNCTYCYNNYLKSNYKGKGPFVRYRSIDNVLEELEFAKKHYKRLNLIQFYDDNFLLRNIKELKVFCNDYKKKISIPFSCLANPNLISEEKIALLKDAGLEHIQIGIESGSDRINREIYARKITKKKTLECVNVCHKYSIALYFDLLFNNPYETKEDLKETLKFINSIPRPFHLQGHNLLFYPGAELTKRALENGYISPISSGGASGDKIRGNMNSPLSFNNDLTNSFYNVHYSSENKVRLNHLISLSQILPKRFVDILQWMPGDVRFYAKLWLKIKRERTFRENHMLSSIIKSQSS